MKGLTAEFGMGSGGTPSLLPPVRLITVYSKTEVAISSKLFIR